MYLSDLTKNDVIFKCDQDDLTKIVFKDEEELSEKCDVGILFSDGNLFSYRVWEAVKLYQKGLIEKILVVGEKGIWRTSYYVPDLYRIKNYLVKMDVSKEDILTDQQPRKSLEIVKYSLELLKNYYDLNNINIALISADFHLQRCIGLFEQEIELNNIYGYGVKDGVTDVHSWMRTLNGQMIIFREIILLLNLVDKGLISDYYVEDLKLERGLSGN